MRRMLNRVNAFFDLPLTLASRVTLLIGVIVLVTAFFFPLWHMTFYSNQYLDGLHMRIHVSRLDCDRTPNRDDLQEINTLNHYIGMRPLLESDFSEFGWLPLCIGGLALLTLRAMIIGKMSKLVDVFVLFTYFGLFSLWSFHNRLYTYGHNLDPAAPIKVKPFTPPLLGKAVVGNFTVYSLPGGASYVLLLFFLLLALSIGLTWRSNRSTIKEDRSSPVQMTSG